MAVSTAQIRKREKETGKKAYTGIDTMGNLHYAFDNATLQSIIQKANVGYQEKQSAKAYQQSLDMVNYNNQWNAAQVDKANAFTADMSAKQMEFQERMSSTSHQREVKDLLAAGLNPVLSANGGASSPAGAGGSGSSATADTSASTLKAQMAMQQMQVGAQIAQTQANIESAQKMAKWQNDLQKEMTLAGYQNQKDIANIQAAASMYGADSSASASAYASQVAAAASQYASNQSYAASKYGADKSYAASKYGVDNPNNTAGIISKGLSGVSELGKAISGVGASKNAKEFKKWLKWASTHGINDKR